MLVFNLGYSVNRCLETGKALLESTIIAWGCGTNELQRDFKIVLGKFCHLNSPLLLVGAANIGESAEGIHARSAH